VYASAPIGLVSQVADVTDDIRNLDIVIDWTPVPVDWTDATLMLATEPMPLSADASPTLDISDGTVRQYHVLANGRDVVVSGRGCDEMDRTIDAVYQVLGISGAPETDWEMIPGCGAIVTVRRPAGLRVAIVVAC